MRQVEIDFEYLDKLGTILSRITWSGGLGKCITCAVAGGAIRDMLLQKPIADIDVFYEGTLITKELKQKFKQVKTTHQVYPDGFNVTHTLMLKYIPVPIQLIQVKNIEEHIATFPTQLSRVSFSLQKGLQGVDMDFVFQVNKQEFFWDDKVDMKYFEKIRAKYSDWVHLFLKPSDNPYYEEELAF